MRKIGLLFLLLSSFALIAPCVAADTEQSIIKLSASAQESVEYDLVAVNFSVSEEGKDIRALMDNADKKLKALETLLITEGSAEILSRSVAPAPLGGASMKFSSSQQGVPKEWHVRGWLLASSKNIQKIFTVIEKKQIDKIHFDGFSLVASRETHEQALNAATEKAIKAFQQRAERAAALFGKKYVLDELTIGAPFNPTSQSYYADTSKKSYVTLTGCTNNVCTISITVSGTVRLE